MKKLVEIFWHKRSSVGRAITLSVLLHVALGIISVFVVILRAYSKPQAQFAAAPPLRPALEPRKLEMKVRMQDLQKSGGRPRLTPRLMTQRPSEVALPVIPQVPDTQKRKVQRELSLMGVSGFGSGFGSGSGAGMGGGIGITLPRLMAGRCDPLERMRRLQQAGGTEECEKAVQAALKWLASTQNANGSWGGQHPVAMTGLALLAFLGHCETPTSGPYAQNVRRAIDWLAASGLASSEYQHGIAAYALAEAYSMTKEEALIPVVEKAIGRIIGGQSSDGAWVYNYAGRDIDLSVTGWQVQALRAGQSTGLKIEGLDDAIKKAAEGVKKMASKNGHFKYLLSKDGSVEATLTGVGVLCLLYLKEGSSEVRAGFKALLEVSEKVKYEQAHLYSWYYNTQACFQKGGSIWNKWRSTFQEELLQHQLPSGAWEAEGTTGVASSSAAGNDAEIYRTCLCTLMLEVYYRYLPTQR